MEVRRKENTRQESSWEEREAEKERKEQSGINPAGGRAVEYTNCISAVG